MTAKTDSAGQKFFEMGNVRITCILKTFNGHPGLRIQACQNGKPMQGPEIPLADKADAFELVKAFLNGMEELGF